MHRLQSRKSLTSSAFTIVELLVVIVVIGILAAITIVAYTGISQRAIVVSVQSDLSNSSRQIQLFQVNNSAYPNSVTDCPTPVSTDICLKLSSGNSVSSYSANNQANPQTYSLAIANGSNIYEITNNTQPTQLASAPLSPVADWLATTQGDHYGNFYDLVSHNWATVNRAASSGAPSGTTGKTIYDPSTQKIYDVPANYLGVNPRSDGKTGSEAVIEEGRTNYLTNTYGSVNDGSKWTTGWNLGGAVVPTYSLVSGVYSSHAWRLQYVGGSGDSNQATNVYSSVTSLGSFAAGDSATYTAYLKGTFSGCTLHLFIRAFDSSYNLLGTQTFNSTVTSTWARYTTTYSSLPANTSAVRVEFYIDGINNGSVIDLSIDAAQVEKGAFATSYIPTTTTAVTRNADNVTVPTTGWNASTGTFVAVAGPTLLTPTSPSGTLIGWSKDSNNFIFLYRYPGGPGLYSTVAGAGTALFANTTDRMSSAVTAVGTWNSGGLGYAYVNGAAGNSVSPIVTPTGMPTTAVIGGPTANPQYYNGSISRAIVYSSALSSGNVSTVTSAVQNGP